MTLSVGLQVTGRFCSWLRPVPSGLAMRASSKPKGGGGRECHGDDDDKPTCDPGKPNTMKTLLNYRYKEHRAEWLGYCA
ncbi:MAG: hypothetical protein Ct9H300mP1_31060 [Planctomycetaceae bacterium]|nr:MAG: hypothetical protein Ct9H300mP1_31060 [Planctomycetaceae bacterium]